MLRPKNILIATIVLLWFANVVAAPLDDSKYRFKKEPGRRALIIGNPDYAKHDDIPSSKHDAENMAVELEKLGFDIVKHVNVASVNDFEDKVISPFRLTIESGDVIVVYFSGHGFGYGAFNFLAPTAIPTSIFKKDLGRYALAVDSIEEMLMKREPGMLIFIIDACRNFANIVMPDPDPDQPAQVVKSMTDVRIPNSSYRTNTVISFASRKGFAAAGSANPGKNSLFTDILLRHLAPKPTEIRSVLRDVATEVEVYSGNNQNPGLVDDSKSEFYLKDRPLDTLTSHQESWDSALDSRNRIAIEIFSRRFATSLHAAAARQWLLDDELRASGTTIGFTSLSPLAVDRAWRTGQVRVINRPQLGFAFPRSANITAEMAELDDKEIGIVIRESQKRSDCVADDSGGNFACRLEMSRTGRRSVFEEAQALVAHKNAVAIRDFKVRASPSDRAPAVETIASGSPLIVKDIQESGRDQVPWLVVRTPGGSRDLFIKAQPDGIPSSPVALGRALSEVTLRPRENAQDLVERADLEGALHDSRLAGRTITWVSLAVGAAADINEREARIGRLTNASYLLKQSGIDPRRITAVQNVEDVGHNGVRVRIFGIDK